MKIRDLTAIGDVIDAAVGAGADSVNDIRFELESPADARTDALEQAVQGARTKADAIAGAAGTQVTAVLAVTEEGASNPPYFSPYRLANVGFAVADYGTPIAPPDELDIRVTVTVVWSVE